MGIVFNAAEIYEIGVQIEKNGEAFYKAAAAGTSDEEAKKLFQELSAWERGHVELFENLKLKLPSGGGEDSSDIDQQQHLYLKAAADSHVFMANSNVPAMVGGCANAVDVLKLALEFEKDSVVVYASMKNLVPESLGKDTIKRLINEEIMHVSMIQEKIALLSGE